ncbi:MAG: protein phosphatase CheZ [Gammaproteobacteria bacterium]|nr:protein phosphatase CheZ [Gammaproteobacteria bacterium]MDP2140858.1 protein phosphatase CheZ [Gammaproteobacteria bacterium]MDP2349399.1 protein phosphatase CheZ [Gammaproteobacteria bacterium]
MPSKEYNELAETDVSGGPEALTKLLRARTRELLQKLDEGDIGGANQLIRDINAARDETLYVEVGRLTRGLHNAIKDFHLDISLSGHSRVKDEISEIQDATSRLNYVINLTEEAANTTMDMVEAGGPIVQELAEEASSLKADWDQFRKQGSNAVDNESLYARVDAMLNRTVEGTSNLHDRLNEILMAQGYQDLSGQVIKRVIALVSDVEQSLVRLVKLASNVEAVAGLNSLRREQAAPVAVDSMQAEGPQMKNSRSDVISGQDDVDALLSSLGF